MRLSRSLRPGALARIPDRQRNALLMAEVGDLTAWSSPMPWASATSRPEPSSPAPARACARPRPTSGARRRSAESALRRPFAQKMCRRSAQPRRRPEGSRPMSKLDRGAMRAAEKAHASARMLSSTAIDDELLRSPPSGLRRTCAVATNAGWSPRSIAPSTPSSAARQPEPPRDLWPETPPVWTQSIERVPVARPCRPVGASPGSFAESVAMGSVWPSQSPSWLSGSRCCPRGPLFVLGPHRPPPRTSPSRPLRRVPARRRPWSWVDGTSYWVGTENGVYQIKGGATH